MTSQASFPCAECGAEFLEEDMLARHMGEAHRPGEENLVCQFCGEDFATAAELGEHERLIHTAQPGGEVPCAYCGRVYATAGAMEEHLARQHPAFPGMTRPTSRDR